MNRFGQAMVMNGTIKDRLKADHLNNTIECIQQLTTTRQRCYIIWMLTLSCQFGIYSCWYCVWTGLVWLGKRSIGPTRMSQTTERQFTQRGRFLSKYQQGTITAPWKSVHRLFIITPTGRLGFHSLKPLYYWLETVLADQKQTQKYEGCITWFHYNLDGIVFWI